jgi:hypothetical protein
MTPSDFFKSLGAPFANSRWSWGAIRGTDQVLFLRVWQDETRKLDGKLHVMVTAYKWYATEPTNLGHMERLRHVKAIRGGTRTFAVMCVAEDPDASPRVIQKFNQDELFVGGNLRTEDGEEWLELTDRVPISLVHPRIALSRTV